MKKFISIISAIIFFSILAFPIKMLAVDPIELISQNGRVTEVESNGDLHVEVERLDSSVDDTFYYTYIVKKSLYKDSETTYKVNDLVNINTAENTNNVITITHDWNSDADRGGGSQEQTNSLNSGWSTGVTSFRLFSTLECPDVEALTCWIKRVYSFSQGAILTLATAVMVFAGVTYMTSAGNENQIKLSKKLIIGALSGVAVMVLGKFFLTVVIGVTWL